MSAYEFMFFLSTACYLFLVYRTCVNNLSGRAYTSNKKMTARKCGSLCFRECLEPLGIIVSTKIISIGPKNTPTNSLDNYYPTSYIIITHYLAKLA
jgi:hypothetical protein